MYKKHKFLESIKNKITKFAEQNENHFNVENNLEEIEIYIDDKSINLLMELKN